MYYFLKEMNDDTDSANIKKTWLVTWGISKHGFDNYSEALSFFNDLSGKGKRVVLSEITSNLDGSIIKKTPVLNSKIKKLGTKSTKKKYSTRNIKFDLKYRIIILVVVFISFFLILYFLNIFSGTSKTTNTVHNHFILPIFLKILFPNLLSDESEFPILLNLHDVDT